MSWYGYTGAFMFWYSHKGTFMSWYGHTTGAHPILRRIGAGTARTSAIPALDLANPAPIKRQSSANPAPEPLGASAGFGGSGRLARGRSGAGFAFPALDSRFRRRICVPGAGLALPAPDSYFRRHSSAIPALDLRFQRRICVSSAGFAFPALSQRAQFRGIADFHLIPLF